MKDDLPRATDAETQVMNDLIDRAWSEVDDGGKAGIAAAVMRGDTVIARGLNEVHLDHDPTRHAEIVAMSRAARALAQSDLSGCTLLTTLQPCEMCLSAMRFAGISRVVFAATKPNVLVSKYFRFPTLDISQFEAADQDGFTAVGGVCEHRIADVYAKGDD